MQPINQFISSDIFTQFLRTVDRQTVGRCGQVNSTWAQTIRDNNYLWQILIQRDFQIAPGKYVCFHMPREEYRFLLQFMREVLASGGTHVGTFFTPYDQPRSFPLLCADAKDRVFVEGRSNIQSAKIFEDNMFTQDSAFPPLPGRFLNSKNNNVLVRLDDGTYQFLDSEMVPITTITTDENITTFEVLEQGFLTGTEIGNIQLWDFNGNIIRDVLQVHGHIFDLFSIQLCDGKPAILAWHSIPKENSNQETERYHYAMIMSLFGLDGKPIKQMNLEKLNSEFIFKIAKIDEERFAIVSGASTRKNVFIVNTSGDVIPICYNIDINDIAVDNGRVYITESRTSYRDHILEVGFEKSITICSANGQYLGSTRRRTGKINVFNNKIYFRDFQDNSVVIHDLSLLPKDNKAWYLDLNHFKMFPDVDKNQVYGVFYCLIKPKLNNGEDYFGCAQHAFEGAHCFTGRFDDLLRKEAITAHLLLGELNTAIAAQNDAGAKKCFDQLPKAIKDSLGWGMWIFEGMPMGDPNFGPNFFLGNPTHTTVHKSLQCFRENGWSILSYQLQQEIRGAQKILNNAPLTQEAVVSCLTALSPLAQSIIQKCVEVLEITPLKHENLLVRYSSDEYKKGIAKNDPIICAINNLVEKF